MSESSPPALSAAAHRSTDPFRLLVDSVLDDAVYMVDSARLIASWNPGAERIHGYRADEIIGQPFSTVFAPDELVTGRWDEMWQAVLAGRRHEFECLGSRKDASPFWASVTVSELKDHIGNHAGFSVVTRDITEKRRAKLVLQESQERHDRLLDVLPDALFVNRDGRIVYGNSAFLHLLGASSSEEVLDREALSIFHPKYHEVIRQRIEALHSHNGTVPLIEEEIVRPDGEIIPVEVTATAITHQGRPSVLVVLRDLRHRKDVERLLRTLIESVKDCAIYMLDPDGIITTWNDGAARIFGFEADEVLGRHRNILFTAEDVTAGTARAEQARAVEHASASEERWRVRKDGSQFWASGVMTALRDERGTVRGYLKIIRDLTNQNQAAAALRNSEERYRSLFNAIADPLFVYDCETLAYLAVNDAAVQKYGYSRDEFLDMTIRDIRPVDDVPALLDLLSVAGMGLENRGVWRHCTHDGTVMEMEISAHGLEYAGRPACVIQARDVTETRRAEAEVARTNDLLRAVTDGVADAVFVKDRRGKYLLFNKAAASFVGKPVEEVLGNDDTTIFDRQSALSAMANDRHVMELNQSITREEHLTAGGTTRFYEAVKSPYRDASGNVLGVMGVSRDITERKQADELMRQQQILLRIAGRVALIGGWSLDLQSQKVAWSDEICAIHEVPAGYQPMVEDAIHFYSPEYRQQVAGFIQACAADGTPFDSELELITAKGRRIWVRAIGEAVRNEDGRIVSLQGAFQDISDRKQAEAEQQRLTERLATTLENITDGFFTLDRDWRFTYVNAEAERLLLRSRDELVGHSLWEAFPESMGMSFEREYRRAVEQHITVDFEEYFPPLAKWFGVRAYPSEQGLAVYFRDVTSARELTAQLVSERRRLVAAQAVAKVGSWETDLTTLAVIWSAETYRIFAQDPAEFQPAHPRFLQLVHPEDRDAVERAFRDSLKRQTPQGIDHRILMPDGSLRIVRERWQVVLDESGVPVRATGTCQDITEQKHLESQYRQAQKMEAVGQLAGGVAHDFNNLLTIISGYSELLLEMPHLGSDVRELIESISEAGERAATLTRQLLGFSRQSMLQPKVLDLNAVVTESVKWLRRLIGEDILVTTVLDPRLSRVKVDPGQLDQVLMNLAVNARDAMPKGGKLTVQTSNVLLTDDDVATHLDCEPGHHVMLAMSDTGCGMSPEVIDRIFEPFYTTKELGRGTGLGLAMVFGIIKQSGGCIHVDSEPGRGSTFRIYLPTVSEEASVEGGSELRSGLRGTETILLVEDEEGVRNLASMSLCVHGYHVLTATDGQDALRVVKSHSGSIDLVLTDVVMPNVSGPELVEILKAESPDVKVLFMSGYTDDAVIRHGLFEADMEFIQKPYTPLGLSRKVRDVLDK